MHPILDLTVRPPKLFHTGCIWVTGILNSLSDKFSDCNNISFAGTALVFGLFCCKHTNSMSLSTVCLYLACMVALLLELQHSHMIYWSTIELLQYWLASSSIHVLYTVHQWCQSSYILPGLLVLSGTLVPHVAVTAINSIKFYALVWNSWQVLHSWQWKELC